MDLGVDWEPTRILWDSYNPHPELAHMQDEFVFLGAGNDNEQTFNPDSAISEDLQELVFPFAGFLQAVEDERYAFEPLLRSGTNGYFSVVAQTLFGPQLNPEPPRRQDEEDYVIAARIRFTEVATDTEDGVAGPVDVVVVADLDFVSEQFFLIR